MANIAKELLKKQFIELSRDHNVGFSVGLVDDSNFFEWNVCFEGPKNTLYEGGIYNATLSFPSNFPNQPPQMKFNQEMWHPNVYPDGRVCISILHPPGIDIYNEQEKPEERWRPIWSVEGILVSVISMLNEPNLESPANVDAAVCFQKCQRNMSELLCIHLFDMYIYMWTPTYHFRIRCHCLGTNKKQS